MANGNRQFDPVAAAATSALDATQRNLRQVRSQMDAPELPAESQAFRGARNAISSVSQFAPANVLARQSSPVPLPGQSGSNMSIPSPDEALPDGAAQFAPSNILSNAPDPLGVLPGNGNQRRRRDRSGKDNGSSNGGNSGSSGSNGSGSSAMQRRRSR